MSVSVDIISVGTLSRNRFWNEDGAVRPAHATTTLLRDGETTLLTDPSLPAELLRQRLDERSGLRPEDIDAVFLTHFRPIHRRGLELFDKASWLLHDAERLAMQQHLEHVEVAAEARGEPVDPLVTSELRLLNKTETAPERITDQIHIFPSPGVTPGSCSLLVLDDERTVVVAGDAIITREYFAHGQAFEQHHNAEQAVESIGEISEIADIIVPGHGDWILNF